MRMESLRKVKFENTIIEYSLIRKNVKNINLRLKSDGSVVVSASRNVSAKYVDDFVMRKGQFICDALQRVEIRKNNVPQEKPMLTADDCEMLNHICKEIYPLFGEYNIPYPEIKIKYLKSMWGSCRPTQGIITLSSRLIYTPRKCMEYVVLHEFAHFIHPNHSKEFYCLLSQLMPDYKERIQELKKY